MKIVFMGTPVFAAVALDALVKTDHEIGYVVTQPDKAKDRGKKVQFTPVKEKAIQNNITVLQPERVKGNDEFMKTIGTYNPDLVVVVAYGQILPKEFLDIPRCGCINIHGSILPRWRGAAPVQRAIIEGDEKTGVTLMYMEDGIDTGDMLAVSETVIGKKNSEQLFAELADMGAELLVSKLPEIEAGTISRIKQDESKSTYASMLFKKDGLIDFKNSAIDIERLIRGLDPSPGAYTLKNGDMLKIWKAECTGKTSTEIPGKVISAEPAGIDVATGDGVLRLKVIQMPGKKRTSVEDFLRGNKFETGIQLGE